MVDWLASRPEPGLLPVGSTARRLKRRGQWGSRLLCLAIMAAALVGGLGLSEGWGGDWGGGWALAAAVPSVPERSTAAPRLAQAYPPPAASPWTFRPQPPTNARGVAPTPSGYPQTAPGQPAPQPYSGAGSQSPYSGPYPGTYPGQQPGSYTGSYTGSYPGSSPGSRNYGQYGQRMRSVEQPSLEVRLLQTRPYVQQPVLVQLDVLSAGNLATASPQLSGFEAVLLEEIAGPTTSVRSSGRSRQIQNRYLLTLTPVRPGSLEVGPFKVSGTLAGGVPFSAVAEAPSRIEVRPVIASVQPWLPLRALELTRELDESRPLAEGRPTTLSLRMEATGGSGDQLPDLESMLASDDFRAYREQTIVDTRLSDDGRTLQGIRTEVYTLVPYSGGRLQLPEVRVNWWNVETAQRESSGVPIRSLSVVGESGPFGFAQGASTVGSEGQAWAWFWIPLAAIALLLIGYWAGVWFRLSWPRALDAEAVAGTEGRSPRTSLSHRLGQAAARPGPRLAAGLKAALQRLDPRAPIAALLIAMRSVLRRLIPASMRVYRCAIDAEQASSPSEWALRFKSSACQTLRTPTREPLPRMADRILRLRPGADAEQLRRLIQELDTALYNGGELDMQRWKRELRRALRPGFGALRGLFGNRLRRARLPALNPGPGQG